VGLRPDARSLKSQRVPREVSGKHVADLTARCGDGRLAEPSGDPEHGAAWPDAGERHPAVARRLGACSMMRNRLRHAKARAPS
jgi:hypothetical protein